jgi:hypothetical protein
MTKPEIAELSMLEENILYTRLLEGAEINLESSRGLFAISKKLTQGKFYAALTDGIASVTITKEAMEFGASAEANEFLIAQAILVHSLANRLLGNFIIKFHKPKAPTKLFNDREAALAWLRVMLETARHQTTLKNKV